MDLHLRLGICEEALEMIIVPIGSESNRRELFSKVFGETQDCYSLGLLRAKLGN